MDVKTAPPGKRHWVVFIVLVALWAVLRLAFPERGMADRGPLALMDSLFALGLLALILLLGLALGLKILRWLRLPGLSQLEKALFSIPLGLGVLAFGVLFLGLAGLLRTEALLIWLLLAGLAAWRELGQVLAKVVPAVRNAPSAWRGLPVFEKTLAALLVWCFS